MTVNLKSIKPGIYWMKVEQSVLNRPDDPECVYTIWEVVHVSTPDGELWLSTFGDDAPMDESRIVEIGPEIEYPPETEQEIAQRAKANQRWLNSFPAEKRSEMRKYIE